MNPLTLDQLKLAGEVMKGGFKIPSAKDIKAKKKARADKKRKKLLDTFAVDQSTGGIGIPSGSTESSSKMMLSQKRVWTKEEDDIVLRLPQSASSYYDTSFL